MTNPVRRVAAIDCGTNSIRLLIAEVTATGELRDVTRALRIVRLGQDVDRTGRLAPMALERTRGALAEYVAEIHAAQAGRIRMVATSAVRDSANRQDFEVMVGLVLGQPAEVLSGTEEAALSFAGATLGPAASDDPSGRALVLDIGGGSTELVFGRGGAAVTSISLDVGSVRLTERHVDSDPPSAAAIAAVAHDVRVALDGAVDLLAAARGAPVIGVAGTITTLAGMALGLKRYDSARIHGAVLGVEDLEATIERLLQLPRAARATIEVLHPGRIDVIAAGAIILRTVLRCLDVRQVRVSEHDILDGVARSLI